MLKTNSKETRAKVRAYIMDNFTDYDGRGSNGQTFERISLYLGECFASEKVCHNKNLRPEIFNKKCLHMYDLFVEWCQGLPSVLDTCYYYNRSAIKDLGDILEQTEEERSKYSESQAESLLTWLIFKELKEGIYKAFEL